MLLHGPVHPVEYKVVRILLRGFQTFVYIYLSAFVREILSMRLYNSSDFITIYLLHHTLVISQLQEESIVDLILCQ